MGGSLPGKVVREHAHGIWRYPTALLGSIVVKGKLPEGATLISTAAERNGGQGAAHQPWR